jgi:hypothetical protein
VYTIFDHVVVIDGCASVDDSKSADPAAGINYDAGHYYLRLAETLTAFLARLHSSAETLDIIERQRVVRLLVTEILVSDDRIVIRHSIPLPTGPSGSHDPSPIGDYSSSASGKSCLLRSGSDREFERGGHRFVR